jgi:hypothetical protein
MELDRKRIENRDWSIFVRKLERSGHRRPMTYERQEEQRAIKNIGLLCKLELTSQTTRDQAFFDTANNFSYI